MADFTVRQKYPAEGVEGPVSMRLDHPHWGDVRRTVFVKGVITDYQTVSDSPIEVQSVVKVETDVGESDFLPIFFHPKPLYWEPNATDFNAGGKYFEKAWMSTRVGDEVIVVTKVEDDQRVPKYVLGFADGCPRIGEDVFRIEGDVNTWVQCSLKNLYGDGDTGPDGLDLKLLTECELIDHPLDESISSDASEAGSTIYWYNNIEIVDDAIHWDEYVAIWRDYYKVVHRNMVNVYNYPVIIGPKLYWVRIRAKTSWWIDEDHHWEQEGYHSNGSWAFPCMLVPPQYDSCEDFMQMMIDEAAESQIEPDPLPDGYYHVWYDQTKVYTVGCQVAVALYNEENLEIARTIIEEDDWPPAPFTRITISGLSDLFSGLEQETVSVDIYRRPHTKGELSEAGMWPGVA